MKLPEPLTRVPQSDLRKTLDALLGEPVLHGLRTVVAKRLAGAVKANAPVAVYLPGVDEPLPAQYRGSTLGGLVGEVPIERLSPYRDQLIAA